MTRHGSRVVRCLPLAGLLCLGGALSPAPATAQTQRADRQLAGLSFSLDGYGLGRLDDSYRLWDDGGVAGGFGLEAGYDAFRLGEATLALAIGLLSEKQEARPPSEVGLPRGRTGRSVFNGELESTSLHAAAILRWRTDRALQPYLALGVGGTRSELSLDPYTSSSLRSIAYGLLGRASLGVRVQPRGLRARRSDGATLLALGLGLEVGALLGTAIEHEGTGLDYLNAPAESGSADRIPVQTVPLGALSPSGGYTRLSLIVVF